MSSAPVRPVLKRSVKVPPRTAAIDRLIERPTYASRVMCEPATGGSETWRMQAQYARMRRCVSGWSGRRRGRRQAGEPEGLLEGFRRTVADGGARWLAGAEERDGGDTHDPVMPRGVRVGIHVELEHIDGAG